MKGVPCLHSQGGTVFAQPMGYHAFTAKRVYVCAAKGVPCLGVKCHTSSMHLLSATAEASGIKWCNSDIVTRLYPLEGGGDRTVSLQEEYGYHYLGLR